MGVLYLRDFESFFLIAKVLTLVIVSKSSNMTLFKIK